MVQRSLVLVVTAFYLDEVKQQISCPVWGQRKHRFKCKQLFQVDKKLKSVLLFYFIFFTALNNYLRFD